MAKQVGTDFIGCVGGLVFYKMDGQYYVRQKSSLSRKRVLKSPKFKRTMENAGVFGKASRIAAKIYRSLDKQTKDRSVYNKLTGMVNRMLKEGKLEEEIISHLSPSQETTQVPSCEPNVAINSRPLCAFAPLREIYLRAKAQRRKGENKQDLKSFVPLCETKCYTNTNPQTKQNLWNSCQLESYSKTTCHGLIKNSTRRRPGHHLRRTQQRIRSL